MSAPWQPNPVAADVRKLTPASLIERRFLRLFVRVLLLTLLLLLTTSLHAQITNAASPAPIHLNIGLNGINNTDGAPDVGVAIKVLFAITLLSLAPLWGPPC